MPIATRSVNGTVLLAFPMWRGYSIPILKYSYCRVKVERQTVLEWYRGYQHALRTFYEARDSVLHNPQIRETERVWITRSIDDLLHRVQVDLS